MCDSDIMECYNKYQPKNQTPFSQKGEEVQLSFKGFICISIDDKGSIDVRESSIKGLRAANQDTKDNKYWKKPVVSTNDTGIALDKAKQILNRIVNK